MPAALRYKNEIICHHLASQYVVAEMSPRVRSRVDTLRSQVPELNDAIIFWAETFADINNYLPDTVPSEQVWQDIEQKLFHASMSNSKQSWWHNLRFWQITGITTSLSTFALTIMLLIGPLSPNDPTLPISPLISSTPNYLAVMSSHGDQAKSGEIEFVVNVYQKSESFPSRMFIQWSEQKSRTDKRPMHLWAKDRQTGELTYIGLEPATDTPWEFNKATWLAVSGSSHLLFTSDKQSPSAENTLFSGPCIQLGSWKQHSI